MKKTSAAKKTAAAKSKTASKNNKRKAALKNKTAPQAPVAPATKSAAERLRDNPTLHVILTSLNELKAEDTVTIDLSDKASIGETMVVTTGRSNVHVAAIADRVVKDLKANGMGGVRVEGLRQGDWVLIDAGSVIVHVFRPEVRLFYNIEKMWSA